MNLKLSGLFLVIAAIAPVIIADKWSWGADTDTKITTTPPLDISSQESLISETNSTEQASDREARFLGIGKKLCSLGIGADCNKKTYPPPVGTHYGPPPAAATPVITSSSYASLSYENTNGKKYPSAPIKGSAGGLRPFFVAPKPYPNQGPLIPTQTSHNSKYTPSLPKPTYNEPKPVHANSHSGSKASTVVQHVHTHTHIHQGVNGAIPSGTVGIVSSAPVGKTPGFQSNSATVISSSSNNAVQSVNSGSGFQSGFQQVNSGSGFQSGFQPVNSGSGFQSGFQSVNSGSGFQSVNSGSGFQSVNSGTGFQSVNSGSGFQSVNSGSGFHNVNGGSFNPAASLPGPILEVESPAYREQCLCVSRPLCPLNNIVPRKFPTDISSLLDARSRGSDILSNATDINTDELTTISPLNDSKSNESSDLSNAEDETRQKRDVLTGIGHSHQQEPQIQERQLSSYTPGFNGCQVDYVCCKDFDTQTTNSQGFSSSSHSGSSVFISTSHTGSISPPVLHPVTTGGSFGSGSVFQPETKPIISGTYGPPIPLPVPENEAETQQYREECQCVATQFCPINDIIARRLPVDISGLINARSRKTDILSNDTETEVLETTTPVDMINSENSTDSEGDARQKRDLLSEGSHSYQKEESQIQERQFSSYIPGNSGCQAGHVCCRNPTYSVPKQHYTCGKSNAAGLLGRVKNPYYVDGDAEFAEYPWQAAILKIEQGAQEYVCGASLISDRHLLTAAHCIKSVRPETLMIRMGEWDVQSTTEFYQHVEIHVKDFKIHPDYYAGNLQNDIAIITLQRPVDFTQNPHISPVCLPENYSNFLGQRCHSTGWGKDAFGEGGKFQKVLKEVEVPVVSHHQCQTSLRHTHLGATFSLHEGFICAGGEEGRDTCEGDGGGPLVCPGSNGRAQLVGLVSWGIGCGKAGIPGVYVNVAHYIDWIQAYL